MNESQSENERGSQPGDVRRVVGTPRDPEDASSVLDRMWDLRERMIALGIDFENDDERIRKVVGRPRNE